VDALEPFGVAVVSGRLGDVGVGGLTLGGGLSFLSGQYGLVCDNVLNIEIVLANASIVNANASSNPDLFFALKGGGNQFGIVTSFTMKAYPIGTAGNVWGGLRSYSGIYAEELINATQAFTANFDPKAAVIVTGEIAIDSLLDIFVVFLFYDGAAPPAGVFDAFDALPTISDDVKTRTYADLLTSDDNVNLYGLRYLIRGTTLPNLPSPLGPALFLEHYNTWKSYVLSNNLLHPGFIFSLAFQPLPAVIPSHATAAGGNALGMDERNGDFMWMEYDISWLTPLSDNEAHAMAMNITSTVQEMVKQKYGGRGLMNSNAQPGGAVVGEGDGKGGQGLVFLNDAMYDQLPLQSYGMGNYERLKGVQQAIDPRAFFAGRTGGFKFT
ncbi:putative FAD-linked oxidoreductase, partial [Lachnellula suecica]